MKRVFRNKVFRIVLSILFAALMLFAAACANKPAESTKAPGSNELGTGAVTFQFKVTDKDQKVTEYVIHTDEATVGAALLKLNLIEGEDSQYGLYVKKVQGILADYNVDGTYWAFYADGAYSMTGVDATPAENGKTYEFKVEK